MTPGRTFDMFEFFISQRNIDNIFINHIFRGLLWNIIKWIKRQWEIISSINFKVWVIICFISYTWSNSTTPYAFLLFHYSWRFGFNIMEYKNPLERRLLGRSFFNVFILSLSRYLSFLWTWVIKIIFWFTFLRRIVSKLNFLQGLYQ